MTPRLEKRVIEIAYALLDRKKSGKCFHLSYLIRCSRIYCIACNNYNKSHPKVEKLPYLGREHEKYGATLHSELANIIKWGETDCSRYQMVNIRINRMNELAMAKPCNGCTELLRQVSIKGVWYSTGSGFEYLDLRN